MRPDFDFSSITMYRTLFFIYLIAILNISSMIRVLIRFLGHQNLCSMFRSLVGCSARGGCLVPLKQVFKIIMEFRNYYLILSIHS